MKWKLKTLKTNPFFLLHVWKQQIIPTFKSMVEHAAHFEADFWLKPIKRKQTKICCSI
jgi:hypothetical protein